MSFTPEEVKQAIATLNACGIEGDDPTTALGPVLQLADSPSHTEWLTATRNQINASANDEERDRLLASQYGHDAVRAVLALASHEEP